MISAVSLLAYTGFVVIDSWIFQRTEDSQLERGLLAPRPTAAGVVLANLSPRQTGGLIGRIDIPRLGISAVVMEGTSYTTLRHALGHISGTALPGKPGNVGVSGHRDTFFRPLRHIRPDDVITLTTMAGEYRYRVVSTQVVPPDDVAVLAPGPHQTLTLVTCYPFYLVGPAPDRFIVTAERVV